MRDQAYLNANQYIPLLRLSATGASSGTATSKAVLSLVTNAPFYQPTARVLKVLHGSQVLNTDAKMRSPNRVSAASGCLALCLL